MSNGKIYFGSPRPIHPTNLSTDDLFNLITITYSVAKSASFVPKGQEDSAQGFNPELYTQFRAAAKASLDSVNDTGWKPMLHCFLERSSRCPEVMLELSLQSRRDTRRRKVV